MHRLLHRTQEERSSGEELVLRTCVSFDKVLSAWEVESDYYLKDMLPR